MMCLTEQKRQSFIDTSLLSRPQNKVVSNVSQIKTQAMTKEPWSKNDTKSIKALGGTRKTRAVGIQIDKSCSLLTDLVTASLCSSKNCTHYS